MITQIQLQQFVIYLVCKIIFPDAKTKDVSLEESGQELTTSTSETIDEPLTADERITTYEQVCQNNMHLKPFNLYESERNRSFVVIVL